MKARTLVWALCAALLCGLALGEEDTAVNEALDDAKANLAVGRGIIQKHEATIKQLQERLATAEAAAKSHKDLSESEKSATERELGQLRLALDAAEKQWLPLWANPYYEYTVTPAVQYYNDEIVTGKAYDRTKAGAIRAYVATREALGPTTALVWAKAGVFGEALQKELEKEQYKGVMKYVHLARQHISKWWRQAGHALDSVTSSNEIRKVKEYVSKSLTRVEADLHRMATHVLGADVPGSGIDAEMVTVLVRGVLYGFPAMIALYWFMSCCCGPRKKRGKPTTSSDVSQATSRGKGKEQAKKAKPPARRQ